MAEAGLDPGKHLWGAQSRGIRFKVSAFGVAAHKQRPREVARYHVQVSQGLTLGGDAIHVRHVEVFAPAGE